MCLIVFSWQPDSDTPLLLLGNRDEFFDRPSLHAHWWSNHPEILAGKDEKEGGTWLGINKTNGKIATVTNFRRPDSNKYPISRGHLIRNFLTDNRSAEDFLVDVAKQQDDYAGFNLLVYSDNSMFYFSNRDENSPRKLSPGIYGLSNHLLDTTWPKVVKAKKGFQRLVEEKNTQKTDYIKLFNDTTAARDEELPDTGVGSNLEKILSPVFIEGKHYGTRATSLVSLNSQGEVKFLEQNYTNEGPGKRIEETFTVSR